LVEFFERERLGLGHEKQDQNPANTTTTIIRVILKFKQEITHFQAAYHPNAPCGVNAPSNRGNVSEITKLKNQQVAVAKDMPRSRTYSGNASAEYYTNLSVTRLGWITQYSP
jgi:hypothetical protein